MIVTAEKLFVTNAGRIKQGNTGVVRVHIHAWGVASRRRMDGLCALCVHADRSVLNVATDFMCRGGFAPRVIMNEFGKHLANVVATHELNRRIRELERLVADFKLFDKKDCPACFDTFPENRMSWCEECQMDICKECVLVIEIPQPFWLPLTRKTCCPKCRDASI